jgi:plastocyanin
MVKSLYSLRSIAWIFVLLVAFCVALSACGASASSAPTTTIPTTSSTTVPTTSSTPVPVVTPTPSQTTPTPVPQTPTPTPSGKPVSSVTIAITGSNGQYAFSPQTITVSVGAIVSWKNTTSAPHSISALLFGGGPIPQGGSFSHTYTQAGTFEFWDAYHPSVKGTVIVQ